VRIPCYLAEKAFIKVDKELKRRTVALIATEHGHGRMTILGMLAAFEEVP
jgi:hypothetical protein